MKGNIEYIEILNPRTSYEIAKVQVTDKGYEIVGATVIDLASGNPSKPELSRKQGVRIDSLIRLLLVNGAERTIGDISKITTEDVKAVKDFIMKQVRSHEPKQD